jgi:hypothetical protein
MEERELNSRKFTRRFAVWFIVVYALLAANMSTPTDVGHGFWFTFLTLPSFVSAIFFACLGCKDAFIKLSDCQQYPNYQVDIETDSIIRISSGTSPFIGRDHIPPLMLYQDVMNLGNSPWGTLNKIDQIDL